MSMQMAACEPTAPTSESERLWTSDDGTMCVLATMTAAPRYALSLRRGAEVIRERRLFGLATAHMLAQGWRDIGPYADRIER